MWLVYFLFSKEYFWVKNKKKRRRVYWVKKNRIRKVCPAYMRNSVYTPVFFCMKGRCRLLPCRKTRGKEGKTRKIKWRRQKPSGRNIETFWKLWMETFGWCPSVYFTPTIRHPPPHPGWYPSAFPVSSHMRVLHVIPTSFLKIVQTCLVQSGLYLFAILEELTVNILLMSWFAHAAVYYIYVFIYLA